MAATMTIDDVIQLVPLRNSHSLFQFVQISDAHFLGSPTQKVGTALSFTAELFSQPSILGSGAEDARQVYTRGLVLGKARNRNSEISPTPPLILTGGQNV